MGIFSGKGRETSPDFQGTWRRAELHPVLSPHPRQPSEALGCPKPLSCPTKPQDCYGFGVATGSRGTTTGAQSVILPKKEITELKVGERDTSNPERTHSHSILNCADSSPMP